MLSMRVSLAATFALCANAVVSAQDGPAQVCPVEVHAAGSEDGAAGGGGIGIEAPSSRSAAAAGGSCRLEASPSLIRDRGQSIIDVRPASESSIAWIPSATHLRLDEVATHSLVKASARVVLIGNGKDTARLLRRCEAWRQGGLSQIRVLDGGLPAWRRAGGALVGNVAQSDRPLLLSERELEEVANESGSVLMFAQLKPSPALVATKARVVQLEGRQASPAHAWARVARAAGERNVAVVFLARAEEADAWRTAARARGLRDPLFFVGDVSRYDAYLAEQASIAAHANKPPPSACERG